MNNSRLRHFRLNANWRVTTISPEYRLVGFNVARHVVRVDTDIFD